ncbi:PEP-CTERM/exosortase system-associated acyltransferase [Methylobacter sp. S3L5C]|uniref:PEP-CTERM/exosortase system-associated acyltransferase n=1 Tax=Methylobacter sp. S3L5C TaxID=2839024 RepID=UPI001FAE7113|nr:PEP-CTERM/exosortase system-associated acyltransferase [Methylobacter sp. S3L5C]UOA09069.1 PEP-CTERM/exosortase system-associated acyltransferase [Methylobacter sp. S3L5C]
MKLDTYSTPPLQLRNAPLAKNSIEAFNEYFEMIPALSDDLKNEVYKLRYQIYCIENNFLNSDHYPDNLEFDEFDPQSIHYLIRHRKSGEYAATVRLILPDTDNPEKLFPLEIHSEIDNVKVMQLIDRKHLGEVSRLCVSKAFRKRKNDPQSLATNDSNPQDFFTLDERRTFSLLSVALIACTVKACYENQIYYSFGSTEPPWFRRLSALGIHFKKIGPLLDYHGKRWPSVIKVSEMIDCVAEKNPNIWNLLTNNGAFSQTKHICAQQH